MSKTNRSKYKNVILTPGGPGGPDDDLEGRGGRRQVRAQRARGMLGRQPDRVDEEG